MIIKITLALFSTCLLSKAAVSVTGVNVVGLKDENGALIDQNTSVFFIVVADTSGDGGSGNSMTTGVNGFGNLQAGSVSTGAFVGDGDDLVLRSGLSSPAGATAGTFAAGALSNIQTRADNPSNDLELGDNFILYWFPELAVETTTIEADTKYGMIRGADWLLPNSNGSTLNAESFINSSEITAASFTVQLVPEPSSFTLIGLGALGLISRRRRL